MKVACFFLLLISASILMSGCATDATDRAFFETGWLKPNQNDARMGRSFGD